MAKIIFLVSLMNLLVHCRLDWPATSIGAPQRIVNFIGGNGIEVSRFFFATLGMYALLLSLRRFLYICIIAPRPDSQRRGASLLAIRSVFVVSIVALACFLVAPNPAEAEVASYYDCSLDGNFTASGDIFECYDYTVAVPTDEYGTPAYPYGSLLKVCANGACVVVRVTDTGGFVPLGRDLDLSLGAAEVLGIAPLIGVDHVRVHYLGEDPYGWHPYKQY